MSIRAIAKNEQYVFAENTGMRDLSVEEVNDVEQFRSLKETWHKLLQQCPDNHIFLTWEWLFYWWQYYGQDRKLRILLIREREKVIGIVPLMQSKYREGFFSVDVLENICAAGCDYSGIILTERKPESVAVLLGYLGKNVLANGIIVRMSHIPDVSDFLGILRAQYPSFSKSLFLNERQISTCPYIILPESPAQFQATMSKKRRANLRRAMLLLQKDHEVEFQKCTDGAKLPEQLQVLFELHQKRWQAVNVKSKFYEPEAREFYRAVSEACHQNKWLNLSFLNVDGKPVSAIWGFDYNNTFYDMTIAFDLNFSDYSVGNLHVVKLIEDIIRNGLKKYDFLKGEERYKSIWTSYITNNIQITMAKRSLSGRYRIILLEMLIKYHNIRQRRLSENFDLLFKKVLRRREA